MGGKSVFLRKKVQRSPNLDVSVFADVIENGMITDRMALGRQLAEFIVDPDTPDIDREAALPYLLSLLNDPVRAVRSGIVHILTPHENLHPDIVFSIAADEEDIALPFLETSPSVSGRRQLAIFRAGDRSRRIVLAGRPDLDPAVVDFIAMEGDKPVVMALLDNAALSANSSILDCARNCKRIYVRFRDDADVVHRLLEMSDLPLEIRVAHVEYVSGRMRTQLKSEGLLPALHSAGFVDEAEEKALVEVLARARSDAQLASAIAFASRRDILTPAILLRAACHGHVAVLEHGLAFLAGVSIRRVRGAIHGFGLVSLHGLHRRAGLPESCFMLVRTLLDVAREHDLDGFAGEGLAPSEFGVLVLEKIATGYDELSVAERSRLAGLLAEFADEETAELALRLQDGLRVAA